VGTAMTIMDHSANLQIARSSLLPSMAVLVV